MLGQSAGPARKTQDSGLQEANFRLAKVSRKIGGTVFVMKGEYHTQETIVIPSDFILITGSREWGSKYTNEFLQSTKAI